MHAPQIFSAAVLAGALTFSALPAFAADRTAEVSYADLDLSTEAGAAKLKQRMAYAVKKVCGEADIRNTIERQDMIRCRKEAAARGDRDVAMALDGARKGEQLATLTATE